MKRALSFLLALLTAVTVLVPFGALTAGAESVNVALGKTVMGGGGGLEAVTDGKVSTDFFWDGGAGPASAIIDLEDFYHVEKVNVVTYYGDGRFYRYTVEASTNGLVYTVIGEKKDSVRADAAGTDFSCDAVARYIKINLTYNSANMAVHLVEVSVYGTPDPDYVEPALPETDPDDPDNVAYGKPTRSNAVSGITASVVDGNPATSWEGADYPRFVDIDLMKNYELSSVKIFTPAGAAYSYVIYGSLDGVNFSRLASSDGFDRSGNAGTGYPLENAVCRIIRVNVTGVSTGSGAKAALAEVKAYGKESSLAVTETREKIVFSSYEDWLKEKCGVDVTPLKDENGRYDIKATYTEEDTVKELQGIVSRLLGEEYVSWFVFKTAPNPNGSDKDFYRIEDDNGKIRITGSDGTCVAAGLNWYLKYFCNVHVSQQTSQTKMPEKVAPVGTPVFHETSLKVRYAYNYCTLSYTMAFYGYDDWRRELDWLYLNGVNLILDTTATEALWVCYLQSLGYNADDAKNYVCGYAYKAWWLMGNLEGYGGTVSDGWVIDTLEMARQNQRSMTVMGAMPALQTFVGAMPASFGRLAKKTLLDLGYPDVSASLAPQGTWAGPLVRPNVLRTDYEGYTYLAQLFYRSQEYIYGQITDYYCGDVCHEGGRIPEGLVREEMAEKILKELMDYDGAGVWMLQRWWDNPIREVLDGFGKYRTTNVMIIDLASAQNPGNYKDTTKYGSAEFGGTPWIFSTLDNYGGNSGMHGNINRTVSNIAEAKEKAKYLRGIGITPEGTKNNPYVFDFYFEMVWRDEKPDIDKWTEGYLARRYGMSSPALLSAWRKLVSGIYTQGNADDGGPVRFTINNRPQFGYGGGYYIPQVRPQHFFPIISSMMEEFDRLKDNECYIYDLTDMMTTYLSYYATNLLVSIRSLVSVRPNEEKLAQYRVYRDKFLYAMLLVDEICAYSKDEMVGNWIGRAYDFASDSRTGAYDDYTVDTMTYNAKALITAWHSGALIDYACRRYNGVMRDYYYVSWKTFFDRIDANVNSGRTGSGAEVSGAEHFMNAWNFVINGKEYERVVRAPAGDETSRGLPAIYDLMAASFTSSALKEPLLALSAKEGAAVTLEEGRLEGAKAGETFKQVAEELVVPEATAVRFFLKDGSEASENDAVTSGACIELYKDGARTDRVMLVNVPLTEEEKEKKELLEKAGEFIAFAEALDTEGFTEEETAALSEALNKAKDAAENGENASVDSLKALCEELDGAKAAALAAYDRAKNAQPTSLTPEEPEPEKKNYIWIAAAAGVALLVGAVAVILYVIAKKKKNKKA